MPITPKALIFDYGNVLCAPQEPADLQAMADVLGLQSSRFAPLYWRDRLLYDEAALDAESYWRRIADDVNVAVGPAQVQRLVQLDVESWSRPSPVMARWAQQLRQARMKTAILSNMPMELRRYLTDSVKWLPAFDHMTFSCDIGVVKPKPEIYAHCLEGLGVQASEALFLDDRPENVDAARHLGIHTILFTTPDEASKALDGQFSLPVPIGC